MIYWDTDPEPHETQMSIAELRSELDILRDLRALLRGTLFPKPRPDPPPRRRRVTSAGVID